LACDGELNPESLRTNCSAEAWISACVAGGSKLNSVLMFRHIVISYIRGTPPLLANSHIEDDPQKQNPTSRRILA
jgi:hypothetical protein